MKRKLVLWGQNPQEEKVLITLELLADENQVCVNLIPKEIATDEVFKGLMDIWRVGQEFQLPDGIETSKKDLVISEDLLPEGYKVENTSLLDRAKTEWHFVVLSAKLHKTYQSELEDFKDKIEKLSEYDSGVWESLKGYWNKVQSQAREKNLFWDHANELRNGTNTLFSRLKELRAVVDEEFRTQSKNYAESIISSLNEIEEKVKENVNLGGLFNELKNIQKKYRDTKFTKEDRNAVWSKIDKAFKTVKEKKYGKENVPTNSPNERLQRRYDGLLKAMEKMERSIKRDDDELKFQNRRAERTEGQLELQIRQAKMKMLEQRVESKREKFRDMEKTEKELSKKLAKYKASKPTTPPPAEAKGKTTPEAKTAEAKTPESTAEATPKVEVESTPEAKAETKVETPPVVKAEPVAEAQPVVETTAESEPSQAEEVNEESSADAEATDSGEGLVEAIGATLGESLGDVMDTVKAVAGVLGDKVSEAVQDFTEELNADKKDEEE